MCCPAPPQLSGPGTPSAQLLMAGGVDGGWMADSACVCRYSEKHVPPAELKQVLPQTRSSYRRHVIGSPGIHESGMQFWWVRSVVRVVAGQLHVPRHANDMTPESQLHVAPPSIKT